MTPCINNIKLFRSNFDAVLMLIWGKMNEYIVWDAGIRIWLKKTKGSSEKRRDIKEYSFLKCAWFIVCIIMCMWCLSTNQLDKVMLIWTTQIQRKAHSQHYILQAPNADTATALRSPAFSLAAASPAPLRVFQLLGSQAPRPLWNCLASVHV